MKTLGAVSTAVLTAASLTGRVPAQARPPAGGEFAAVLPAGDPPSYDAHREDTAWLAA